MSDWQDRIKALAKTADKTPEPRPKRAPKAPPMPFPTGAEIRKAREARGLTLIQLAERAGISYPALSKIETGKVKPHPSTLQKIVAALNALPPLSIGGEEPKDS